MDAVDVPLGDLLTDDAGRLIVLGGFGKSQSVPAHRPKNSQTTTAGATTSLMAQYARQFG
jgi:hypothetical protein